MSERATLAEHGTKIVRLKPASLVQAARADLERKARNANREFGDHDGFEAYAFHRRHVRKSADVCELLKRAKDQIGLGQMSGKYNTRLLYSDESLLQEAIDLTASGPGA